MATFYGVGVGPGDPELITLKAKHIIENVKVVAYAHAPGANSLAATTAHQFINATQTTHLAFEIPMCTAREPAQNAYDKASEQIKTHLLNGQDVAYLCEGDPFFYASFMYIWRRLKTDHTIEIIPGITSLTACAAAAQHPLTARNDSLCVLPATLPIEKLTQHIEQNESIAFIKVGNNFNKIYSLLEKLGYLEKAILVVKATHNDQKITPLNCANAHDTPYFSIILLYKGLEKW